MKEMSIKKKEKEWKEVCFDGNKNPRSEINHVFILLKS